MIRHEQRHLPGARVRGVRPARDRGPKQEELSLPGNEEEGARGAGFHAVRVQAALPGAAGDVDRAQDPDEEGMRCLALIVLLLRDYGGGVREWALSIHFLCRRLQWSHSRV